MPYSLEEIGAVVTEFRATVRIIIIIICDRICEKVPFSHTKFDPFF